ncbi:hypothetical protein [Tenacibaculum salmonis]|uniref:hypothetical protein n=1 Tax=Tenacibaculum sp. P3-BQ1 TaxID=3232310 RepID=UPI0034E0328D
MKKTLLILLIIMAPIAMVSQKKKTEIVKNVIEINKTKTIDSLKNQINLFHSKFAHISKEITTVKDLNISTEKELISLRSKTDFYATSLNLQTGFYLFIVGLIGLITFASINKKIKKVEVKAKKRIELQKAEFDKELERIDKIEGDSYFTMGNLNVSLAQFCAKEQETYATINYTLEGIKYILLYSYYLHNEKEEKLDFTTGIYNLEYVKKLIDFISDNPTEIEKYDIKYDHNKLLKILDEIDPANHTVLKNEIAKVRVALIELNKKIEEENLN